MTMKVGVFKFSSCDGCQLAFFELEEDLLRLSQRVEIEYFLEASSKNFYGEFDLSFVEGSVSTQDEVERIKDIRERSKVLVAIGACATSGGIQSARNYEDYQSIYTSVYKEEGKRTLEKSYPLSHWVKVDYQLPGCPINVGLLREFLSSVFLNKSPNIPSYSLCLECKRKLNPCVLVYKGVVCLGPITRAGCGALCPSFGRGCYGCYGPVDKPNVEGLEKKLGSLREALKVSFNAYNPAYRGFLHEG